MAQTLDTSFTPPTFSGTWQPAAIGTQSDGKLLVALRGDLVMGDITDLGLHRLNVDGSIDDTWVGQNNWNPEEESDNALYGFTVLRDDTVLVWLKAEVPRPSPDPSRDATRVVRLLKDGALDPDFPRIDLFWPGFGNGVMEVVVDNDENFIACGTITDLAYNQGPLETWPSDRAIVRFLRDGTFDKTTHATSLAGGIHSVVPLSDGRYLIVGSGSAAGLYVDGALVDEFARGRAMLFHDFSQDTTFNDSSTFDGYGRQAYGGLEVGSGTRAMIVGDFQTYSFGGGSFTTNMARVYTSSGTRESWPTTTGSLLANTMSRMPGASTARFDRHNLCVDRKDRLYLSGIGWIYRIPTNGQPDPDWDYQLDMVSDTLDDPYTWPKLCKLHLDPTHTKLYVAGNDRLDRLGTTLTQRLIRIDVDTLDGVLESGVAVTMQPADDPDPDPDPDPDTVTVNDGLALSTSADALPIMLLRDRAALARAAQGVYEGTAALADAVALGDPLAYVLSVLIEEGLVIGDEVAGEHTAFARVLARLLVSGQATGYADAIVQILDGLVLAAVADAMAKGELSDTAAMSGTIAGLYQAFATILEKLVAKTALDGISTAFVLVSERIALSGDVTHAADLVAALRDGAGFATTLAIDNGEYIAWVMNTEGDKPVSRYTQYPFNSFAKVGGRYMACDSTGLHWLDGNDDSGEAIKARLRAGLSAMGTRRLKRLPEAFIAYRSDGTLLLRVIQVNDETGEKEAGVFLLRERPASNTRENRFTAGRGWKAVEFDFELENVDGADFDLTSFEWRPLYLDRRTRG